MYELIVIGGGPGGCAAALRAAQGGLSVALFEPRQVGGTCLNRGCVPTKALLHGAGPGCDWPALAAEVERVVSTLRAGQEKQLRAAGVELIPYRAVVTGPHTVEAGGAAYEAAHILVAAGSEPALPPIPGLDTPGVVTSDGLLSDLRPLDRLAIIGGGVIGVELACVWAAAGARVTILEAAPRLLPTLERELGQSLAAQLRQDGVEVFTGAGVTGVAPGPAVAFTHRGEAYRLEADAVLVATGRRPATGGLFTGDLLPELERGFLRVDGQFRTSIPSLYAIGDAIGGAMLAHKAEAEGRFVADLLLGRAPLRGVAPIPACVYTSPELAQVGLTADEARARGIPCAAGKCVLGGQRPYPHRGGEAGLCQAGIPPGEPRPVGGSVVLLPGHRSHLRARPGGHAGADGGAAAPPGAPPSHLCRGHFRGRGGGLPPLLAPFFHKEASAAGGRLFSFHIHSLKFDHSRRSLHFFALSLTEVLSAGDITALPCRNLR